MADALAADEYVTPLPPALRSAQADAVELLAQVPPPPTKPGPDVAKPRPGTRRVDGARVAGLRAEQARDLFDTIEKKLEEDRRRRLTVDWVIEEEPES